MARFFQFLLGGDAKLTDEQLMWRFAGAGDLEAFQLLHERWHQRIFRLGARMTGDVHCGEDVAQETFARVFRAGRDFQQGRKFSTWLWRIALNLCHDELRRCRRRSEVPLEAGDDAVHLAETLPAEPTPARHLELNERQAAVRAALLELPEHYRVVVVLRHFEDLKFAGIAEALDLPVGTVKSRLAEALKQLNARLRSLDQTVAPRISPLPHSKAACL